MDMGETVAVKCETQHNVFDNKGFHRIDTLCLPLEQEDYHEPSCSQREHTVTVH